MLTELAEPGIDKKIMVQKTEGKLISSHQNGVTISNLRHSVESAIKYRKTQVIVIDEAVHLMRFSHDTAVMQTLKSLANTTGIKLVLVGSFDLLELVLNDAQIARRSKILNLDRYHIEKSKDRQEFHAIVEGLMDRWPCEDIPNFVEISDNLMEASLGCIGLLKSFLSEASSMQLTNNGKWDRDFLRRAVKSNALVSVIRKEIEVGEGKLRDALVEDGLWDAKALNDLSMRMEARRA
jgi:hypothetical protein